MQRDIKEKLDQGRKLCYGRISCHMAVALFLDVWLWLCMMCWFMCSLRAMNAMCLHDRARRRSTCNCNIYFLEQWLNALGSFWCRCLACRCAIKVKPAQVSPAAKPKAKAAAPKAGGKAKATPKRAAK